jgi:hypothetical protein
MTTDTPPRDELLFYLSDDIDAAMVDRMRLLVHGLAQVRSWQIGPPVFIDETEGPSTGEDAPVRTVGGVLTIAKPTKEPTGRAAERAHYDEVATVVEALRAMTAECHTEVELQLGRVYVGDIREGVISRTLQIGLLDEWARLLA